MCSLFISKTSYSDEITQLTQQIASLETQISASSQNISFYLSHIQQSMETASDEFKYEHLAPSVCVVVASSFVVYQVMNILWVRLKQSKLKCKENCCKDYSFL